MKTTETMYHVTFLVPEKERWKTVRQLQRKGVCQVEFSDRLVRESSAAESSGVESSDSESSDSESSHTEPSHTLDELKQLRSTVQQLETELSRYAKKSVKTLKKSSSASSEIRYDSKRIPAIEKRVSSLREEITQLNTKRSRQKRNITDYEKALSTLRLMPDLRLDHLTGSKRTRYVLGTMEKEAFANRYYDYTGDTPDDALLLTKSVTKDTLSVIGIFRRDKDSPVSAMEQDSAFTPLTPPPAPEKTTVSQEISRREHQIKLAQKESASITKRMKKLALHELPVLQYCRNALDDDLDRMKAEQHFQEGIYHVRGTAWVPASEMERFRNVLAGATSSHILSVKERDDAPTKLSNGPLVKPFEEITRLYSVPRYKRFDPTVLIAIFFPLIFGIMYSDTIYGLLLIAMGLVMVWVQGRDETREFRNYSRILYICGVMAMVVGALTGNYFGNAPEMFGMNLPNVLDVMTDIIPLVIISLSIGLIHLLSGLVAGFHERVRRGVVEEAIREQGVWILFILGVLLALLLPNFALVPAIGIMILSLLIKAVFVYRQQGVVSAIQSVFDVSKLTGDLASYVRIMALAIGTSGIALAVNILVGLASDFIPVVGVVVAFLIFIVGHVFNIFISGLGAFIHTLRLHFLEHFGRYYEGDGSDYEPFKSRVDST